MLFQLNRLPNVGKIVIVIFHFILFYCPLCFWARV